MLEILEIFDNAIKATPHKHLGITLNTRLSFSKYLETVLCKINKTISIIRKFHNLLPRLALITLYRAFVYPLID